MVLTNATNKPKFTHKLINKGEKCINQPFKKDQSNVHHNQRTKCHHNGRHVQTAPCVVYFLFVFHPYTSLSSDAKRTSFTLCKL